MGHHEGTDQLTLSVRSQMSSVARRVGHEE